MIAGPTPGAVRLPDGRDLAYMDVGRRHAFPVFYLHGAIGSPLELTDQLHGALEDHGARLILLQRPGFGASHPRPGRALLDFPGDVRAAADALGLGRFAVIGVSAGGPYALACAHRLGGRITTTAVVSSLSPLCAPADVPGLPPRVRIALKAVVRAPGLVTRVGNGAVALVARRPELLVRAMAVGAPPVDRSHLADGAASRTAIDAFLAATAGGVAGLVEDHVVTSRPWGFGLEEIPGEVHVWHGCRDAIVPVEHALQLAAALPRCQAFMDPEEGHFFFRRRVGEILQALVRSAARVAA